MAGLLTLLLVGHRLGGWIRGMLPGLGPRLGAALEEVSQALDIYRSHPSRLFLCWLLSVLIFTVPVGSIAAVAAMLEVGSLSPAQYATAGVWALLLNFLPVSPGGIGVGEAAFAQICAAQEIVATGAPYASVFLVFRALVVLATLPGLIAFIAYRNAPARNAADPAVEAASGGEN